MTGKRNGEQDPDLSILPRKRSRSSLSEHINGNFYVVCCVKDVRVIFTDYEHCKPYLNRKGASVISFDTLKEAQCFASFPMPDPNTPDYPAPYSGTGTLDQPPLVTLDDIPGSVPVEEPGRVVVFANGTTSITRGDPAKMGFGVYFSDHSPYNFAGSVNGSVSSQRADLKAALEAIKTISQHGMIATIRDIDLNVNSNYVKSGMETWMRKWKQSGWKNANKGAIKNLDLWREVDSMLVEFEETGVRVRVTIGSGSTGSFAAGRMAEQAMREEAL